MLYITTNCTFMGYIMSSPHESLCNQHVLWSVCWVLGKGDHDSRSVSSYIVVHYNNYYSEIFMLDLARPQKLDSSNPASLNGTVKLTTTQSLHNTCHWFSMLTYVLLNNMHAAQKNITNLIIEYLPQMFCCPDSHQPCKREQVLAKHLYTCGI